MISFLSRIYLFFNGYKKVYLHSSDIMLPPQVGGITTSQFIIISRLLDAENFRNGNNNIFWHETIFQEEKSGNSVMHKNYADFIKRIMMDGIDMRDPICIITRLPYCMSVEGTHRLGYLLSLHDNFGLWAFLGARYSENTYDGCGVDYARNHNTSENEIHIIMNRYDSLLTKMNKSVLLIMDEEFWVQYGREIMDTLQKKYECNDIAHCYYKKYLPIRRLSFQVALIHINLPYQKLSYVKYPKYIRGGRWNSEPVNSIRELLDGFEKRYFYIFDTITESVSMQRRIMENNANYKGKKRIL